MFNNLTEKFTQIFANVTGKRKLTEKNISEACGMVRRALIDADVHFKVVRDFITRLKAQVAPQEAIPGVEKSLREPLSLRQGPLELLEVWAPGFGVVQVLSKLIERKSHLDGDIAR